jgi:hypothetical protein
MTADALAGRAASYYPAGRDRQRPGTLAPEPGETPAAVVASLDTAGRALDAAWAAVAGDEWGLEVREPPANPDLGTVALAHLPLSRLTEVEVHGTDLGIGIGDWSPWFVSVALPYRIWRLGARAPSTPVHASWVLVATDGPAHRVTVSDHTVVTEPLEGAGGPVASASASASVIEGTTRDLLALLLGRPFVGRVTPGADRFAALFPGP